MAIGNLYPDAFNPQDVCIIAKTGFNSGDNDYYLAHSAGEYQTFIQSKKIDQQNNFSYIAQDRVIRYPANAEDLIREGADYVCWQNRDFNGSFWYGFITQIQYINPNRTDIHFEVDVVATFIYNITIGSQYVSRMTVKSDNYCEHLTNENLPCGDYIYSLWSKPVITHNGRRLDEFFTAIAGVSPERYGYQYDGMPFVGGIYIATDANDVQSEITQYKDNPDTWQIIAVYALPQFACNSGGLLFDTPVAYEEITINPLNPGQPFVAHYPADSAGWRPNNWKLYTYPYTLLQVTNNIDKTMQYKFEGFINQSPTFLCACNHVYPVTPTLYPTNYMGSQQAPRSINTEYALDLGEMPQIGYSIDSFAQWSSSTASSRKIELLGSIISGAVGVGVSYAMGDAKNVAKSGVAAASGIVGTLTSQAAQYAKALQVPPEVHTGSASSNAIITMGDHRYGPSFAVAQIPQYIAKQYDDYFSLFGYKLDKAYTIDLMGDRRPLFDYYETLGCHIDAHIPMEYAHKLEDIFNNGVRFWYNPDKVGDYSDANIKENSLH